MSLTISEKGLVLTETVDGVTMSVDYSFNAVNDFVHSPSTHFEELQALCLGMASFIDNRKGPNETSQTMSEASQASAEGVGVDAIVQIVVSNIRSSGDIYQALCNKETIKNQ